MSNLSNLKNMKTRLSYYGGQEQQDRMIRDKRWTLDHAVNYSYQGARVKAINSDKVVKALINPNKLKMDYDDKIISIGFEHGFTTGTVFEWINTNSKWLIYLQDLTELAYFKGDVRRCNYSISWESDGVIHSAYAAVRGPVETRIDSIQKGGINFDIPNHSLNILLPLTDETAKYFQRYSEFYLSNTNEIDRKICWRVEGRDAISTPGILEITAVEYYSNKFEDDIENGVVGGLIVEPIKQISEIEGEQIIKPRKTYTYKYNGSEESTWTFNNSLPIEIEINGKELTLKWTATYRGEISLQYGSAQLSITVESLFG